MLFCPRAPFGKDSSLASLWAISVPPWPAQGRQEGQVLPRGISVGLFTPSPSALRGRSAYSSPSS
eukprot:8860079-Lingulodinium_polyedra.AAC.1